MVLKAVKDLKIDLTRSYLIGDSEKDVELARLVKVKCVRIPKKALEKPSSVDREWTPERPILGRSLREAVNHILDDLKLLVSS